MIIFNMTAALILSFICLSLLFQYAVIVYGVYYTHSKKIRSKLDKSIFIPFYVWVKWFADGNINWERPNIQSCRDTYTLNKMKREIEERIEYIKKVYED